MTTANPYQAPSSDVTQAHSMRPYQPRIFTAEGRIGRLRYLAYGLIINLCFIPVALLILAIATATTGDSGQPSLIVWILGGIAYIALIVASFILAKRRLNDLNQSGWLSLLLLIPLVNFGVILWLIFAPGEKQQNSYGAYPIKNTGGIVALALILPFIAIVGIIAAIALPAYVDYTERAASSYQDSLSEFE
jgi:uncharacterized membrane protein YhaH (DUF805 family)